MVCLAGRALIAFAGLFGLALVTLAPWAPAPGNWITDFELADEGRLRGELADEGRLRGRLLKEAHSEKPASHDNHAATRHGLISAASHVENATAERELEVVASAKQSAKQTGFIVPDWKPRCNVNRTKFVPSCLPEQIYKRKNIDDWSFAEYCGVKYAAVRVANQEKKGDIHGEVYALMFKNLVMTCLHYIAGMAVTGIFLKKPNQEQQQQKEEKEKEASCMDRMKDIAYFCMAGGAAAYAFSTSILSISRFWMQASQYFHGVWMLPTSATSYHCRAILLQEFLYYRDILGYLTLSAFAVMDGLVVCLPLLMWLGLTSNVCCTAWICLPFAKLMAAFWSCLVSCVTCKWVPAFCSMLKYLCCCGWLKDCCWTCCSLVKVWCGKLCAFYHWIFCECGICQAMQHCCLGCWKQCFLCFWQCGFYCCHCSCLCCLNFLCHDPCVILSALVAILVFLFCLFPLAIYLGVGMLAFFCAVLLTVLILLVPILLVFWLVTQLVVCIMWVKAKVLGGEVPEFMGLCEYYAVYYGELTRQFQESFEWIGTVGDGLSSLKEGVKKQIEMAKEAHKTLPGQVTTTVASVELFSKDSRVLGLCMPTVLVLLLVAGSSIMACSTLSMMSFLSRHDMAWAACSKADGTPTFCVQHTFFDELRTVELEDLVTTSGVKMPPTWPVLDGCVCLECDGSTKVAEVDRHTVCGPRELPRPWEESFACAAHADGDARRESRRLGSAFADVLEQNASDVIKPNGRGDGGFVLEGVHKYLGSGIKIHPKLLNTYNLEVEHPPRSGCYGLSLPAVSMLVQTERKNGWCNCSSQKFVPTAIDSVYTAPTVQIPPYGYDLLPPLLKAEVKVGDYKKLEGDHAMLTAASKTYLPWEEEAVADQKLETEEWVSTYGADPQVGIQMGIVSGLASSWRSMARSITELLRDIFVDTFYGYYKLLTTRAPEALRWLTREFYTLQNFVGALTDWLKTGSEMDFKECQKVVLCGRSMASLMTGIATATTVFKMKAGYLPLRE